MIFRNLTERLRPKNSEVWFLFREEFEDDVPGDDDMPDWGDEQEE